MGEDMEALCQRNDVIRNKEIRRFGMRMVRLFSLGGVIGLVSCLCRCSGRLVEG